MPTTYKHIATQAFSSTVTQFTSIPQTYTDIVLKCYLRASGANVRDNVYISINGTNTFTEVGSYISYSNAGAFLGDRNDWWYINNYTTGDAAVSNVFGSSEFYFPQYSGSRAKTMFGVSAGFNNNMDSSGLPRMGIVACNTNNTAAITTITLIPAGNWLTGSTISLYGIA